MYVCKAPLGHRLPFCCYSSLFRAGLEAKMKKLWGKDQTLNAWFPGQNKTAPEFVPLNSFPASVPPRSSLFTEHRNDSNKRLWMHIWNEVSTTGFLSTWQRLSAQLLNVKTTQEALHLCQVVKCILYNKILWRSTVRYYTLEYDDKHMIRKTLIKPKDCTVTAGMSSN